MTRVPGPTVAIVVRTKDRPLLLRRALRSICDQTYDAWECVVVNDGGDVSAVDAIIAATSKQARGRITALHIPTSRGRWASANAGVSATTAPLLVLHDDDDTWEPTFLEKGAAYLQRHPDRNGVVSRIRIVWERDSGHGLETISTEPFLPHSVAPLLMDQMRFNHFVPIAFLYRRSLHDAVGPYDEQLPVIADWQFNTRVLAAGPLEYLGDEALANWHQRPQATGVDGNSVIEHRAEHARTDALLRDEAFRRTYLQDGGATALYFERRIREVEELVKAQHDSLLRELRSPITAFLRRSIDTTRRWSRRVTSRRDSS